MNTYTVWNVTQEIKTMRFFALYFGGIWVFFLHYLAARSIKGSWVHSDNLG